MKFAKYWFTKNQGVRANYIPVIERSGKNLNIEYVIDIISIRFKYLILFILPILICNYSFSDKYFKNLMISMT